MKILKQIARLILKKELESLSNQIKILRGTIQSLKSQDKVKPPMFKGKLSNIDIYGYLNGLAPIIQLSDKIYSTTSLQEAKIYQIKSHVHLKDYKTGSRDCDEYSFESMGFWNKDDLQFAYGIAWSKNHAFNLFIDNLGKVYIVEPQSAKFIPINEINENSPDGANYLPLRMIIM